MLNFWESNVQFEPCLYRSGRLGFLESKLKIYNIHP